MVSMVPTLAPNLLSKVSNRPFSFIVCLADASEPGVVESLSHEVAPFGIKTLLLEPGTFRTNLFSEGSLKANRSVVDDYKQASNDLNDFLKQFDSKQPGDPKKFVSLVIDLVREEGAARDKKIPFRLPVGEDCVLEIRQKLNGITDVMNEWDAVIKSTTY